MAIETTYNYKNIEVKDAIIKVDRLWGSSKEGWTALVGVYTKVTKEVPAREADLDNGIEAIEAQTIDVLEQIEEFNFQTPFKENERVYKTVYLSLMDKYGGIEV